MHPLLSKYLFYYPSTLAKGEPISLLMPGYRSSQWLSKEKLLEKQLKSFSRIFNYARRKSVFYERFFKDSPDTFESLNDIKLLPTIDKQNLINNVDQMIVRGRRLLSSIKTTGGSTGEPVTLYKNPIALARERCATWRGYEWASVTIGDPQLRFWGVPHSSTDAKKAALIDFVANRLRVSAFDIREETLFEYYQKAMRFRPAYVYGYVNVIEQLAEYMKENNLRPLPSVKSVITTSEVLTPFSRKRIEESFGVRVFNEYGCGEVGSIAHECEQGRMHIMAENLLVEVDAEEGSGEIVVTDFFNLTTPLIRYRLGDFATLSAEECPCGRGLPVIEAIHGRAYDLLQTPSGKRVHPDSLIYVFEVFQEKTKKFGKFQAVQVSPKEIIVNIVPREGWRQETAVALKKKLSDSLEEGITYTINLVDEIPREASGKMRVVKRNF